MNRFGMKLASLARTLKAAKIAVGSMLAAVCILGLGTSSGAQEQKEPVAKPCVPSQVGELFVREGGSWRVNQVQETGKNTAAAFENEKAIAKADGLRSAPAMREARKLFERAARAGYAPAQVNLAVTSLGGWGTTADAGAALYWFHAAADQGFAPAFYDLGVMYLNGCGVKQDYGEAQHYFEKGAERGDAAAETNLGYLYDHGYGVVQNRSTAATWYRKAADLGEAKAQYNLADLYAHGDGVEQDDVAAFAWFQKAAWQGHSGARVMLGYSYAQGRGVKKDLASAYLWFAAAVLQGDSRGQAMMAALEKQLEQPEILEAKEKTSLLVKTYKKSSEVALLQ